jgi:hypothetical protein
MALIGFGYKCKLSVIAAKVTGTHNDFLLMLTEDNLPPEIFDADGSFPALNGGGDIRFSVDNGGLNQIPCEIVSFITNNNPALGEAEIWLKIPQLTSRSEFYIWWNKAGETQPLASSAFGSQTVYSAVEFASNHNATDSTGKHSLTKHGSQTGDYFDGINDRVSIDGGTNGTSLPLTKPYSISCVVKPDGYGNSFGQIFSPKGGALPIQKELSVFVQSGKITTQTHYGNGGVLAKSGVITYGSEYHVYAEIDVADQTKLFLDGAEQTGPYFDYWNMATGIGGSMEGPPKGGLRGDVKWVRARNGVYSADRVLTESHNQKDPAGFFTVGGAETALATLTLMAGGSVIDHLSENMGLDQFQILNIETAEHIFQPEITNLYQAQSINIKAALHSLLQENVEYNYGQSLNIHSNFQDHQGEEILFDVERVLFVDDGFLFHKIDRVSFLIFQILQPFEAYHSHISLGVWGCPFENRYPHDI